MRYLIIVIAALSLAACDNKQSEKKTTNSVQYYLDHAGERKTQISLCDDNPGELDNDPNCINAYEADKKAMFSDMERAIRQE
nr:EexN family lipoprotein [Brucella intermedia]